MTRIELSHAERLKIELLESGLTIRPDALDYINSRNGDRPLTPADYASTSGVILQLPGDVWVNAPIAQHNGNFVSSTPFELGMASDGLAVLDADGDATTARFWLQPAYHGQTGADGMPYNSYAFTHTDRVRIAPIEGCAFTCTFCDLPYEFRYRSKLIDGLVESVAVALADPVQPAAHILISGGTPRPDDYGYVRDVYDAVLTAFPRVPVDVMMVPLEGVLDVEALAAKGLAEVSVNLEVWSDDIARRLMPLKYKQGRAHYLDFLERSADLLGGSRVRSMLMLGLEPLESTLEGVEAIASRGCVPVLSPFRPDPSTPLRNWSVPSAEFVARAYAAAYEITESHGVALGPPCIPCSHNTVTFPAAAHYRGSAHALGRPNVI